MSFAIDATGRLKVTMSAADAIATTLVNNPLDDPIPDNPVKGRRLLVIAFPTDKVVLGPPGVSKTTGYGVRGTGRADPWTDPPVISQYSSRAQFLRGQYTYMWVTDDVDVHGFVDTGVEIVVALELA